MPLVEILKLKIGFGMISLTSPPWRTFELSNAPAEDVGYPCEEADYPNAHSFSVFPKWYCFHVGR